MIYYQCGVDNVIFEFNEQKKNVNVFFNIKIKSC